MLGWIALALFVGISAVAGAILLRFFRYRYKSLVRHEHTPDMDPQPCEGYTDKYYYRPGELIRFFVSSDIEEVEIAVTHRLSSARWEFRATASKQPIPATASAFGCNWKQSAEFQLPIGAPGGYYECTISQSTHAFSFPIVVTHPSIAPMIALLAPTSTWTAYNSWGGQSLYQNALDSSNTYLVSTQRPNTAFMISHSLEMEQHIAEWFMHKYDSVLLPDVALDARTGYFKELSSAKIIVLVFHCEYISPEMYAGIDKLIAQGKSVIVAGANMFWWKVRWHDNYTRMECHKDLTGFKQPYSIGGMWKHSLRLGERTFGIRYIPQGYYTYAPFDVVKADHWLFADTKVKTGQHFGERGITGKPICAVEMDQMTKLSTRTTLLARGLNRDESGIDAGGHITLREISERQAILSLGSVHTGGGLGMDPVLTKLVENFVARYA